MALGAILGAGLGALAGGQASTTSQSSVSGIRVAPETELEKYASGDILSRLKQLGQFTDIGPGAQDISAGLESQRGLAELLKSYSQGGFLPSEADFATAGKFADATLGASFRQQEEQAARLAAQLGRPVNDPIIQAKLRQGLGEQRGAAVAQQAQQLPLQRLQFASGLADVQQQLASQAMANRQALIGQGSQLREADRAYRIATGERYGNVSQTAGGGLAGAISGGLAGAGAGLSFQNALNTFGQKWGAPTASQVPAAIASPTAVTPFSNFMTPGVSGGGFGGASSGAGQIGFAQSVSSPSPFRARPAYGRYVE